jgi:hypothetical protein
MSDGRRLERGDEVLVTDPRTWAVGQSGEIVNIEHFSRDLRLVRVRLVSFDSERYCEVPDHYLKIVRTRRSREERQRRLEEMIENGSPTERRLAQWQLQGSPL